MRVKRQVLAAVLLLLHGCGDDDGAGPDGSVDPSCPDLPPTRAMGNWDVVPEQLFDGEFAAGVVAFHEVGVDVVFAVDGGDPVRVTDPAWNERTGVYEYVITLQAGDHEDGPVTITATIWPDCPGHLERELEPLVLLANAGGTLANDARRWVDCQAGSDATGNGTEAEPFSTIEQAFVEVGSGGTVLLKAGECYRLTDNLPAAGYDRWTTVEPAPGVERDQVAILTDGPGDSTGRFGEDRVRWRRVRLYKDVDPGYSTFFYFETDHRAWFDGAELYDARGQWNGGNLVGGNSPYRVYYTDAYIHDVQNSGYSFGRNVVMENIGSDVFRGSSGLLSVNLTVLGIDRGTTDAHPDFIQFYNPDSTVENVVLYNTRVYDMGAQGIFGGPGAMRNVAFVNLLMEKDPPDSALTSQITGDWDHVLLWHVTTVDAGFFLRETESLGNFFIQNGIWANLHAGDATSLPGFTIDHNHITSLTWEQTEPMGTSSTLGDPLFADEPNDDYRLQEGSPAVRAGVVLPGVPADVDGRPWSADGPDLGAFAR